VANRQTKSPANWAGALFKFGRFWSGATVGL
jgi:hypothetical protein